VDTGNYALTIRSYSFMSPPEKTTNNEGEKLKKERVKKDRNKKRSTKEESKTEENIDYLKKRELDYNPNNRK
jgi:hypothetical protein